MNNRALKIILIFLALLANISSAWAAKDFNIKNNTQSFFYVNGTSGNIGIGSVTAGQLLDVQGTARMIGFDLTGNGAASGNVMVTNGVGVGTWMAASTLPISGGAGTNYWLNTAAAGNVGISTMNTVGIGTTSEGAGAGLVVMNGNVGIGTIVAPSTLTVSGNMALVNATTASDSVNSLGLGSLAGGNVSHTGATSGIISAATYSDFAFGDAIGSAGNSLIQAGSGGNGADFAFGYSTTTGNLLSTGNGAMAGGYVSSGTISATNDGSVALGEAASGTLTSTSSGTIAMGLSEGTFEAIGGGSIALGAAIGGTLESSATGSIAMGAESSGSLEATGNGSVAMGFANSGPLEATTSGSIAMGYSNGGTLQSTGSGSLAMGFANFATLQSTGNGSVAMGQNVQANANNAFALGLNVVNSNASSFMVGFSSTPALTVTNSTVGVGIGTTTTASGGLVVEGNVGIGTFNPFGGGLIVLPASTGNVGIGSLTPGTALDVSGVTRTTGFTLTGNGAATGNVMVTNGVGVGTWMAASTLPVSGGVSSQWITTSGVGIGTYGNVGIGTITPQSGLVVTNGNVGIGTWSAHSIVQVEYSDSTTINVANEYLHLGGIEQNTNGYRLIGFGYQSVETMPSAYFGFQDTSTAASGKGELVFGTRNVTTDTVPSERMRITTTGNVGIGSTAPGQMLDVQGTARMVGFTLSNNGAAAGNVMVTNGVGVGTWMAASTLPSGAGTNYWLNTAAAGNVGISTTNTVGIGTTSGGTGAGLVVMNGNVGIGTWVPQSALIVMGGNVGIGTSIAGYKFGVFNTTNTSNDGILVSSASGQFLQLSPNMNGGGDNDIVQNNDTALIFSNGAVGTGNFTIAPWSNTLAGLRMGVSGNVGLGTFEIQTRLAIVGGNVGIGTWTAAGGNLIINGGGNVGIGSAWPGQALDVRGTVRDVGQLVNGNVGIGTSFINGTDEAALTVMNGNVGIGTWVPSAGLDVETGGSSNFGGNVGIGSAAPGAPLDIQGGARMTGFTLTGNGVASGNVMVTNGVGVGTWMAASTLVTSGGASTNYWLNTAAAGNVGISTMNTVGIGTTSGIGAGLVVMNGNVGVGTWIPAGALDIKTGNPTIIENGNVGIGSDKTPDATLEITQVTGTPPLMVSSTVTASGDYLIVNNGGNVGIGTWTPAALFQVNPFSARPFAVNSSGNVGIGSTVPQGLLDIEPSTAAAATNGGNTIISAISAGSGNQNGGNIDLYPGALTGSGVEGAVFVQAAGGTPAFQTNFNILSPGATSQANLAFWDTGTLMWYFGKDQNNSFYIFDQTATRNVMVVPDAGNMELMPSGGNVGIGSTAPGKTLDVSGTVRMTSFDLTGNGAASGSIMVTNAVGVGTWMPINTIVAAGAITSSTGNEIAYYNTPSPSQTLIGNANMVFVSPNVGLGTTAPLATLQVVGNIGIGTVKNGDNFIANSPPSGGMIIEGNVGIGTWVPNGSLVVIGGNVGIGTATAPAYNLDLVNGTSRSRPVRRITTITETTTAAVTINSNITDVEEISGYNNAAGITLTIANPSPSNPNDGDFLEIRVLDGGTAITIAYGANFTSTTTTMPLTTVASTWLRILFEYNSTTAKWECVAST